MRTKLLIFTIIITLVNCSNNIDSSCDWEVIPSIIVPQETENNLNKIFSKDNTVLNNSDENDFILKITSKQQLNDLSDTELDISLDFDKYFIIGGRIQTNSISNKISNHELKVCYPQSLYKYEITIEKCTECYPAFGFLYYWKIYPTAINTNEIELSLK